MIKTVEVFTAECDLCDSQSDYKSPDKDDLIKVLKLEHWFIDDNGTCICDLCQSDEE